MVFNDRSLLNIFDPKFTAQVMVSMVFNDRSLLNSLNPNSSRKIVSMVFNDRSLLNFIQERLKTVCLRFNGLQ